MKKILFSLFFLLFSLNLLANKLLIIYNISTKNNSVFKILYEYTIINDTFFIKNLKCDNLEFHKTPIKAIINKILNNFVYIKSETFKYNENVNDFAYFKSYLLIDLKYKVLEKNNEKYYIFNVCYPVEKENVSLVKKVLKRIKDFFNE